ncbi:pentatricopeptide repeat-containing protein At1g20230 [Elaeis guineensis]|uniref:Pentatricopeptide repeat-containing protein At1g20230 n=1 Tax=Elaeis guineensis var. tenera TaxID=51953 RepID=A0A6I9R5M1_ELAGV|nr:pentatricopeptide repeat-containing protein At1g20230 [Elaeis guineensis]
MVSRQSVTIPFGSFLQLLHHPSPSLLQAQQAHAGLLKSGHLPADAHLATKLLSLYADHLRFPDASLLLHSITDPDPFLFSTLISAFTRSRLFSAALSLLSRMLALGLTLDPFVLPTAFKACAGLLSLPHGRQLHSLSLVTGHSSDPFVQSSLVHMYLKCRAMVDAHRVFDRMTQRSVVSWSALIAAYASRGNVVEAMKLFGLMRGSGVEPNSVTWNGLIAGFSHSGHSHKSATLFQRMHAEGFIPDRPSVSSTLPVVGDIEDVAFGGQIHGYVIKVGLESDSCVVSALIDMYGKCRRTEEMVRIFDEVGMMEVGSCNALVAGLSRNGLVNNALQAFREFQGQGIDLNVVSWTSIVACCAQNGKDMEALELFREMQFVGVEPNLVTIPCVLPACANIATLMHGKSAHCFSLRKGFSEDVYVASALVDMYAKCGRIRDARTIFDAMPSRNVVSWNAMMGGYAMHGKAKDVMELFNLMQASPQKPDFITFTCVLSACSQAGLTEEGERHFYKMHQEHGIVARMEHYACMVSLLGRAGKLEEAYDLIRGMPSEPDACVWGALLGSCRVHGNVRLGEIAAEKLFELEPGNAGNYVLLSNIYAAKGMWDGVDKVRDIMKSMGVRKNPGCSWIEIKNKVHMMLAGDKSHPQMNQIADRLEKLSVEMKRLGYLPSTDFVLQDVEEQDKEQILCGHSEKLAIALGLINTSRGTPLRVIKNLRICGDCHVAIKFISSFERREIFVRDTNRFHHFKDGVCSCGDYW